MTGNVIFMDGFDMRLPQNDPGLWTARDYYVSSWVDYAAPETALHGYVLQVDGSNPSGYVCLRKDFDQQYTHVVVGFRVMIRSERYLEKSSSYSGLQVGLFSFLGPTSATVKSQIQLGIDPFQRIVRVYRGQSTELLASSQTSLKYNVWDYIELRVLCHPTAGEVELRINGKTEVLLTGINTTNSSPQTISGCRLGIVSCGVSGSTLYLGGSGRYHFDDFIALDASGGIVWPNGASVLRQTPDADGTYSEWSSTGASNYTELDEIILPDLASAAPDGDTTVLTSSVEEARVSVGLTDRPLPGETVLGMQLATCLKTADSAGKITPFLRLDESDYDLLQLALSTDYAWRLSPLTQNPATEASFTLSELNEMEVGWRNST